MFKGKSYEVEQPLSKTFPGDKEKVDGLDNQNKKVLKKMPR